MTDTIINIKNPLNSLGFESEDIVTQGEFGAVMARAGIGKTSFAVQLAIYAMVKGKKVLHISLEDPVNKINLWYGEVFNAIADKNKIEQPTQAWETILPNRFIMTIKVDTFSVPGLEERLSDLTEQNIFTPDTIVIDGFPFEGSDRSLFEELKELAAKMGLNVWFTVRTHRHEQPGTDGIPVQIEAIKDLFGTAIQILPEGDSINLKVIKGKCSASAQLKIDTETMLITE